MVHAGCWAHVRRYFFQAVQLNSKDLLALGIVTEIDKLFELEAEAKAAGFRGRRPAWSAEGKS